MPDTIKLVYGGLKYHVMEILIICHVITFLGMYMSQNLLCSYYLRIVHLSNLTIQRRLALSLHKDDTLYKEIYHFFLDLGSTFTYIVLRYFHEGILDYLCASNKQWSVSFELGTFNFKTYIFVTIYTTYIFCCKRIFPFSFHPIVFLQI